MISLRELPVRYIRIMVVRKEKGMPMDVSPAFRNPMKYQMISETRNTPTSMFMPRVSMASLMYTVESWVSTRSTPCFSKMGVYSVTISSTLALMSRALLSSVLSTERLTAGRSFMEVMTKGSR